MCSLEVVLGRLCAWGHPKLSKMDGGWYSRIDVFVTGKGVNLEIKSDMDCPTPIDAVKQVEKRLYEAISSMVDKSQGVIHERKD